MQDWRAVVRLALPEGWSERREEHEGAPVAVFEPPGGAGGVLRLVTDVLAPREDAGGVEIVLRELALRFVRPQDPRAGDRIIEPRPQGGLIAQAVMRTEEEGRAEVHYLWLIAEERAGRVVAAMFSHLVPAARDGLESTARVLQAVDDAVRQAELT